MIQGVERKNLQNKKNCVAFLFIGSGQNFEIDYDKQYLIDQGVSFQLSQKGMDQIQLIREDRDLLRSHAKNLQQKCEAVSFDSIVSKQFLLKKSQVIQFIQEKLQKYQNYNEINIHFDGPSIKYTGDWVFKDNNILKQEELLHLIVASQYRNNLIIVSNSNFSSQLLEQYNKASLDNYVCHFSTFLFISTCLREQQFHSFYQFYNYQCRDCCFVKQLENSHSNNDMKKIQLDSIDLSSLVSPFNNLLNYNNNHLNIQNQCPSHRYSFNDVSTQINTARNLQNQSNIQISDTNEEKKLDEKIENPNQTKKLSILTPRVNQNARSSLEIKSQDVSYEFLSTNHTFNNNNQSFKVPSSEQIKYFFSQTQAIKQNEY